MKRTSRAQVRAAAYAVIAASGVSTLMSAVLLEAEADGRGARTARDRAVVDAPVAPVGSEIDMLAVVGSIASEATAPSTARVRTLEEALAGAQALGSVQRALEDARSSLIERDTPRETAVRLRSLAAALGRTQQLGQPDHALRRQAALLALGALEVETASAEAALAAGALVEANFPGVVSADEVLAALRRAPDPTSRIALVRALAREARRSPRLAVELRWLATDDPDADVRAEAMAVQMMVGGALDGALVDGAVRALEGARSHALARALAAAKGGEVDDRLRRRFEVCTDPAALELFASVLCARGRHGELREAASRAGEPWAGAAGRALARADVLKRAQ